MAGVTKPRLENVSVSCLTTTEFHSILKSSMQTMYIKTFSKGQMTLPKTIRQQWGVGDEFWLKLTLGKNDTLTLEPMGQPRDVEATLQRLQALPKPNPDWFDLTEQSTIRQETEKKLTKKLGDW